MNRYKIQLQSSDDRWYRNIWLPFIPSKGMGLHLIQPTEDWTYYEVQQVDWIEEHDCFICVEEGPVVSDEAQETAGFQRRIGAAEDRQWKWPTPKT